VDISSHTLLTPVNIEWTVYMVD